MKMKNNPSTISFLAFVLLTGCTESKFDVAESPQNGSWLKHGKPADTIHSSMADAKIQPVTYFAAGQMFEKQGNFSEAVVQYGNAIQANPDFVAAYNRLGIIYCNLDQNERSEQFFRQGLRVKSDLAYLHNNLGFCLMKQRRWKESEAELVTALKIHPQFERARVNLGLVYAGQNRYEDALHAFKSALPDADAFYNLGLVYKGAQRYAEAAAAFNQSLTYRPGFAAAGIQMESVSAPKTMVPQARLTSDAPVYQSSQLAVSPEQASPSTGNAGVADEALPSSTAVVTARPVSASASPDPAAGRTHTISPVVPAAVAATPAPVGQSAAPAPVLTPTGPRSSGAPASHPATPSLVPPTASMIVSPVSVAPSATPSTAAVPVKSPGAGGSVVPAKVEISGESVIEAPNNCDDALEVEATTVGD